MCHLLDLHDTRDQYVLVNEWHDDVAILDCPIEPKCVEFFQLKTKDDGDWSLTMLLTVRAPKPPKPKKSAARKKVAANAPTEKKMSYLAKMYGNFIACEGNQVTSSFVSNARFGMALANGQPAVGRDEICLSDLKADDIRKIAQALKTEHCLSSEPDCASKMFLKRSPLAVHDHAPRARQDCRFS